MIIPLWKLLKKEREMNKILYAIIFLACSCFANSPGALKQLTKEHQDVFKTHEKQYITIVNKKELAKNILVNKSNFIFELIRYRNMIFNGFLIEAEKDFKGKR